MSGNGTPDGSATSNVQPPTPNVLALIDITHKPTTLREATATALVSVSDPATIAAVKEKRVPKGDVLESARVAALFGVKKTHELIPDCHPLPVEHAEVGFTVGEQEIIVTMKVRTIYRTGVEVEAMHGASVAALTIYDMLKPVDKGVMIGGIRLLEKKGGKSDWKDRFDAPVKAAVLVISDSVSSGKKEDRAGATIVERLEQLGVACSGTTVVPDEPEQIATQVRAWAGEDLDLVLTTGGTGLSPRDRTPEAIAPLLDREVPGIMEAARSYGQERMPWAMMSRGIAGMIGRTLVITLPGSTRGAQETLDALFPFVLHVVKVQEKAFRHGE